MKNRNYWTPAEIEILKGEYSEKGTFISTLRQRHTQGSIKAKMYEIRHPGYAERNIIGNRRRNKEVDISDFCQQVIDGVVLGDGYIQVIKGRNTGRFVLNQTRKHKQWLVEIQNIFEKNGIKSELTEQESKLNGKVYPMARLETGFYMNFKTERDRWYVKGKKIIPDDISLSPVMLAHWYIGDGTIELMKTSKVSGKKYYRIKIYTNSFEMENLKIFLTKLNERYEYNFRITTRNRNRNQPITMLGNTDKVKKFLRLISPYKVSCFDYKWRALDDQMF